MRIEVTIAKTSPLPAGAIDAPQVNSHVVFSMHILISTVRLVCATPSPIIYRLLVLPKKTNHALAQSCKKRGKALMIGF